ncbi:MAG: TfoX/Sxy family protein [Rubricoccaceae bacterium]|nr:TfoX/Sxy family protein [Rubricoccaceae bacterium]
MSEKTESLARLKNLGPQSVAMLREAGIHTDEDLRRAGSVLVYKILKHRFPREVSLLFLYAIEGALKDRHWNSFTTEEKARLRAQVEGELVIEPGRSS